MFYPSLTDSQVTALTVISKSLQADATYLDRPECPYSSEIKAFFRTKSAAPVATFVISDDDESLDQQIKDLLNELNSFNTHLGPDDVSEKMSFFRTKTALLEKLVTMRERILDLKKISVFRNTILEFLDEICTKDQIDELRARLEELK